MIFHPFGSLEQMKNYNMPSNASKEINDYKITNLDQPGHDLASAFNRGELPAFQKWKLRSSLWTQAKAHAGQVSKPVCRPKQNFDLRKSGINYNGKSPDQYQFSLTGSVWKVRGFCWEVLQLSSSALAAGCSYYLIILQFHFQLLLGNWKWSLLTWHCQL